MKSLVLLFALYFGTVFVIYAGQRAGIIPTVEELNQRW